MRWRAPLAGVLFMSAVIAPPADAQAPARGPHRYPSTMEPGKPEHPDLVLLRKQMTAHPELPPISFWYAVAWCETRHHWDRGKDWGPNARAYVSGGLGIANSTWRGYGGRRFARKAALASKWAQMFIANRVGFLGHQTDEYMTWADREAGRKFYRPAAGFRKGWGGVCYKEWVRDNKENHDD